MVSVFDTIADELAERGYAVADQFLSQNEVDAILALEEFQVGGHLKKAGIGKNENHQINEAIRGDFISWIEKQSAAAPLALYLDRVQRLMQHINQTLFLSLKDFEVHFTVYPVGSYYKRHLDQFRKDDHRKLSLICYLNNDWQPEHGGQLRLYLPDGAKDVLPIAGRLMCFRSDQLEHEVLPATRERLSLTGWILDQHADLKYL